MSVVPRKWLKWVALATGIAGIVALILLELGWLPAEQAQNAVIFLLSFIILDGVASKESSESSPAPQLFTNSDDVLHEMASVLPDTKHETFAVVHGNFIMSESAVAFAMKNSARLRSEKQMHSYAIVVSRIADLRKESFERRFELERDASLEGRFHYYFIDAPFGFGCNVFDQKHWEIDFPPTSSEPKGSAIFFKDYPEGARLIASFIRHQWLERPGVTMSLSEAYEKWKAIQGEAMTSEPTAAAGRQIR
jgi:hypothetical protein